MTTLNEIDKAISLKKQEIENKNEDEALKFISQFMEDNALNHILDFLTVDIWEFIKCSLYINCKEKDIDKYKNIVDKYKDFFSNLDLDAVTKSLIIYSNIGKMDEVITIFKNESILNSFRTISELINISASDNMVPIVALKAICTEEDIDLVPFLNLVKENGRIVLDIINLYEVRSKLWNLLSGEQFEVKVSKTNESEIEKKAVEAIIEKLHGFKELSDIDNILNNIQDRMNEIKTYKEKYERNKRKNDKEIDGLNYSRNELDKEINKKLIVRYREITKKIKDPNIKYLFLSYIYEHNKEYQDELQSEHNLLTQDSKLSIQALLKRHEIPNDSYEYESIPSYTKTELETILNIISVLNLSIEAKIYVIQNTSLEKIMDLKLFLERNMIPSEYFQEHISLLDKESVELNNLKNNIDLLKKYNISIELSSDKIDIFTKDPIMIEKNLLILESYDLLNRINNNDDLSFLLRDNLEEVIDKYLELGFEEYLEIDLSLLNKKEIKRLEVLKSIGIPITSKSELDSYLNEDKEFFISLDKINNYIQDDRKYVEEPTEQVSIGELDKYASNRLYDFNGIKISRRKVERQISLGNTLYQSIIYNTYLSEEELKNISKIVNKSNALGLTKQ